ALSLYLDRGEESTVYQLVRLLHHILTLHAAPSAATLVAPLVLACQATYDAHWKIQIELCCILRLALPHLPPSLLRDQKARLRRLQTLHPTQSTLVRECNYTLQALLDTNYT
ncbi:hypothetical protein As57867_006998, partial [Aphanomyces stellatus]